MRWGNARVYYWPTMTDESRVAWDAWQEAVKTSPLATAEHAQRAAAYFATLATAVEASSWSS